MGIVSQKSSLTEEEMQTLKSISGETQSLVMELGEIELIKIQLEERKNNIKNILISLGEKETQFTKSILDKYGKVSIDPTTGEITSISS
jgi:hypothetical protein